MNAPNDLDAVSQGLWSDCLAQLKEQDTWVDTDSSLLASYCRCYQNARWLRQEVGTDLSTEGSTGQLKVNPLLELATKQEQEALKFAHALLLTPVTRKRHAIMTTAVEDTGDPLDGF